MPILSLILGFLIALCLVLGGYYLRRFDGPASRSWKSRCVLILPLLTIPFNFLLLLADYLMPGWGGEYHEYVVLSGLIVALLALTGMALALLFVNSLIEHHEPEGSHSRDQFVASSDRNTTQPSDPDSSRLLSAIVATASNVVFAKDPDGRYLLVNRQFESLFRLAPGSVIGKTDYDIFPKELADMFRANDLSVLRTGTMLQIEEAVPSSDGLHTYMSVKFPIHDEKGKIIAIGGIATDITALKHAQGQSHRSTQFLDSIFENIPAMIFLKEAKNLSFVRINRAGERLLGIPRRDLIGKTDFDFFPREQAEAFRKNDFEVLTRLHYLDVPEEPIETVALGRRILHTKKIALFDERGEPAFLLGISDDITEFVESQQELEQLRRTLEERVSARTAELASLNEELRRQMEQTKRAERQFAQALESAPSAMVMIAEDGTIVLVNSETELLFGYPREQLLGQPVETLLPERFREAHPALRQSYLSSPVKRPMGHGRELFGARADGSEFPVEIGLNPIELGDERFVLSAIVDISIRRRAEQILQRHALELERSNKELDQFARVASHDLKSPLRALANLARWIREDAEDALPSAARENLGKLEQRVKRMQTLLDDLFEYSQAGRSDRAIKEVDVATLLEQLRDLLDSKRTIIVTESSIAPILTNKVALEQCLRNLISNAIKHNSNPSPEVRVTARRNGDFVLFTIRDNGPGIEPKSHQEIFEMNRTLGLRPDQAGSGMGLAIVKRAAELSGGRVWVESELGKGATFFLEWPVHRPNGNSHSTD